MHPCWLSCRCYGMPRIFLVPVVRLQCSCVDGTWEQCNAMQDFWETGVGCRAVLLSRLRLQTGELRYRTEKIIKICQVVRK